MAGFGSWSSSEDNKASESGVDRRASPSFLFSTAGGTLWPAWPFVAVGVVAEDILVDILSDDLVKQAIISYSVRKP
jgi:hypothetical protein